MHKEIRIFKNKEYLKIHNSIIKINRNSNKFRNSKDLEFFYNLLVENVKT